MSTTQASPTASQKEEILRRLRSGQALTTHDAQRELGCRRLAARIHDLRADGHPIQSEMVEVKNRHGHTCRVARYALPSIEQENTPFGDLAIGARFAWNGLAWRKETAFAARCLADGRQGGRREIFEARVNIHPLQAEIA